MHQNGLEPTDPNDHPVLPESEGSPCGPVDSVIVTGNHRIFDLKTGCGITVPLRDLPEIEGELGENHRDNPLAGFEEDSFVRIFNQLE